MQATMSVQYLYINTSSQPKMGNIPVTAVTGLFLAPGGLDVFSYVRKEAGHKCYDNGRTQSPTHVQTKRKYFVHGTFKKWAK